MNINQMRTPEGLDYYLNEVLRTLPTKLPDKILQTLLWQKVKNDFQLGEDKVEQLYVDDNDNVLVIKVNNVDYHFVIGYLHIADNIEQLSDYDERITNGSNQFVTDLKKLCEQNNWLNNRLFIVTTYRLSNYPKIRMEKFSNDTKYMYLTESPEPKDKRFEIALDTEMTEYIEGDIMLKKLNDMGNK